MNRIDADMPVGMLVGNTTVAVLAALGLMTLLPMSGAGGPPVLGVAVLTVLLAGGLVLGSRQMLEQARQNAFAHATMDPHTGLTTAFVAEQTLAMEFAAAQRGRPLAVVLTRIEHFPRYAVTHGRPVAHRYLRLAGRTLGKHRRGMHTAAHYGKGEGMYLSILSGMDMDGACVYARRVRRELMSLKGVPKPPAVSIGIVVYDISMTSPSDLLDQAERAVARASGGGGKILVVGQLQTAAVE